MPRILIGISVFLMTLSLIFGFLNTSKVKGLRNELVATMTARDMSERARAASEKKLKAHESVLAAEQSKAMAAEAKATSAQADLSKAQNEKAELEARRQASEGQVLELQRRVAGETVGAVAGVPASVLPNEIKAVLDDTRQQLEAAEQEKAVLADKVRAAQDRVAAIEEEKRRREGGLNAPGVHGTVLAVNQGVVPNSEMLVMREGSLIGKIRISSVEPTTSIGDIITNSLARGVQVQPGDIVIYAGNTRS